MWDDSKFIAFDFETSGQLPEYALQPWRVKQGKAWVTSLVWGNKAVGFLGGLAPNLDMLQHMLDYAIENNITVIGWNVAFDISWLLAYGFEEQVMRIKWLDGMLLWRHYFIEPEYDTVRDKKKSYGLKACVAELLPEHAGYEEDVDFHDPSPDARAKLHTYNQRDVKYTLALTKHWYNVLSKEPRRLQAALIEAESLPLIARANLEGMLVDTLAAHELASHLTDVASAALGDLQDHGVTEQVVRSPVQLAKLMFDVWGLPVLKENVSKKTGKTSRSTDKEVLHELSFQDKRAAEVRLYREALGNKTKFADAPLASVAYNGDGCTHPAAMVFGTYTGRMTYASKQGKNKDERQTGFALHQEKRGKDFRNILIPPPGYTLMEFDAAGQEFRWMAIAAEDPVMLELCAPGEDPHGFMGSSIIGEDYRDLVRRVHAEDKTAKDARQLGKVANLSCIAEGTLLITQRGVVCIEHIQPSDRVWDGVEFVEHGGVVCNHIREVITYEQITATPDHQVLVAGRWVPFSDAARYGWRIEPAMGQGWARSRWQTLRVMGVFIRHTVRTIWCTVLHSALRLWCRKGSESEIRGDRTVNSLQEMCKSGKTRITRALAGYVRCGQTLTKTSQQHFLALQQFSRYVVSQLRWTRYSVQVYVRKIFGVLDQTEPTTYYVSEPGYRQDKQRRALRAREFALGVQTAKPTQHTPQRICDVGGSASTATRVDGESLLTNVRRTVRSCWVVWRGDYCSSVDRSTRKTQRVEDAKTEARVYDILDCGPRNRFAANGVIVHNCQYRTSAKKLRVVARVQYNIPMELPQAQLIHGTYQQTYKKVPDYWKRQIRTTKLRGYVETFAGRQVQVVGNWDGTMGWSMESTSINYRIQGTGADQKYLALSVLKPYLTRIGAFFAWELHDGVYFYVPDKAVPRAAVEIKYLLDHLPYEKAWGFSPPIPLPWDCKFGKSWGSLKEWQYD